MKALRELSIREKLTRVAVLASGTALLSASVSFATYDLFAFRNGLVRRLSTSAQIVGANSVSALLFQDQEAARTTLAALRAEPNVVRAAIYTDTGTPFASYARDGGAFAAAPLPRVEKHHRFEGNQLHLYHPVEFDKARVGTVYIHSDMREMGERVRRYAGIVAAVSLGSFVVALLISSRFQRAISGPILHLADTARVVSSRKDYSVRAAGGGQDEVGLLVATFNEMLENIEQRDAELEEARSSLERRVADRTVDLQKELAERRRTEEALKRSQGRLAEAQRLARVGSWEWDVGTNSIAWSDELYRLYGVLPAEFAATYEGFLEFVHPEDRARVRAIIDESFRTGKPFSFDHRILRADGTVLTMQSFGSVVRDPATGLVRMVGTGQDITERKAAEEERAQLIREQSARAEAESARRASAFLAHVSATLSASLDYDAVVAAVARLAVPEVADWCTVYTVDEAGALQVSAVQHASAALLPRARALAERHLPQPDEPSGVWQVIRTGQPDLQARLPALLGADPRDLAELECASARVLPLSARGSTFGAILFARRSTSDTPEGREGLARSLADRAGVALENARLYREAQDANRLKDEFLATLSHELRTPLNAIVGWSKLLRSGQLDPATAARAIETIDRNAAVQTQLIEDILDVSRIVAGKLRLNLRAIDLAPVVEAAVEAVKPTAEAREIRVRLALDRSAGLVAGDADRLQQVIWNLLSNAIKFTPRGGHMEVRLARVRSHVEVTVTDTGMGIKPQFLPYVFERFRQGDSSSTRPHGGLGLGLAIVKHLVESHGGAVDAESDGEGRGATFRVQLPVAAVTALPAERSTREDKLAERMMVAREAPGLSGLKVLVVDDEPDTREILVTVLKGLGVVPTAAANAKDALRLLGEQRPDVLLSDIEMPDIDGYSLIRQVRTLPEELGGMVPAAALTAYARVEDRTAALAAGFQIHMAKPVKPAELAAALVSLASRRSD
jgi:PAS domain S-box-containing protein